MLNVISVDVEEYFHAANLAPVADRSKWEQLPSTVVNATSKVLNIFSKHNVQGTFFILGFVAKRHPELVKSIAAAGHEIASHGWSHQLAYEQSPEQFYEDVHKTKSFLEELTSCQVLGYRAPNFSITAKNQWAYDQLIRAGYVYDSSCYPVWHPRYANLDASIKPEFIKRENGQILVFPLATFQAVSFLKKLRLPVAGGAYWRLFPLIYTLWGLRQRQKLNNDCTSCYFHPWELDLEQPEFNQLGFLTKLRHYGRIDKFESVLDRILSEFTFEPFNRNALSQFSQAEKESA